MTISLAVAVQLEKLYSRSLLSGCGFIQKAPNEVLCKLRRDPFDVIVSNTPISLDRFEAGVFDERDEFLFGHLYHAVIDRVAVEPRTESGQ